MSNKIVVILVAVLFVLMVGLSAGLYMIWTKLSTADATAQGTAVPEDKKDTPPTLGTLFPLEPFIVNLADADGKRYLRLTMDLELTEAAPVEEIKNRLPQVRDCILMVLPSKRFEDIRTGEGKTRLRSEIISQLNGLFGRENVTNIFFTEFVVQ